MLKPLNLYIDLGTTNTSIYLKKRGFAVNEPSLLALKKTASRSQLLAHGAVAKSMLGKTPLHSRVYKPLQEGVISDFDRSSEMLRSFLERLKENLFWMKPQMVISLPHKVTRHERQAVEDVGLAMGAGKVELLDEPIAAALGAGLPVLEPRGQMIVDIGGGTTEAAIISLGGIVRAEAMRLGGESLDQEIIQHLRQRFNFLIGEQTSESLKKAVASALPQNSLGLEIGGVDLTDGLPKRKLVTSQMIFPVIDKFTLHLCGLIKRLFEDCPEELASDLVRDGMTLAGGTSLLNGLSERLLMETGLKVTVAKQPQLAVAQGGSIALDTPSLLEKVKSA
jgi:rod shape-determining protein MreB